MGRRDRRRKLVGLSKGGTRALARLADDIRGAQAALLEPLEVEKQAALIGYLQTARRASLGPRSTAACAQRA